MANANIRDRLLKRRGQVAKETFLLGDVGEVEIHEVKPDRFEFLESVCTVDGKRDNDKFFKLLIAETLHADGDRLFNESFKEAIGTKDDLELVDEFIRSGEQDYIVQKALELSGFVNRSKEVEELKN